MFVVLLTNRVYEAKAKRPAKVIADVRADLADAAALAVTDYADGPMVMPAKFRADAAVDWNKPVRKPRSHRSSSKKKSASSALHSKSSRSSSSSKAKPASSSKSKAPAKPSSSRKK